MDHRVCFGVVFPHKLFDFRIPIETRFQAECDISQMADRGATVAYFCRRARLAARFDGVEKISLVIGARAEPQVVRSQRDGLDSLRNRDKVLRLGIDAQHAFRALKNTPHFRHGGDTFEHDAVVVHAAEITERRHVEQAASG